MACVSRRRLLIGVLSFVAVLALLGACTTVPPAPPVAAPATTAPAASAPTTAPAPASAPAATSAAAQASTAAPGAAPAASSKELVVAIGVDPITFDPRRSEVTEADAIIHHINEPLIWRDDNGKIIPWLAESWEYTDPTTLKIKLRPGVTFDNGEPFDSASVKYTLESVMDPNNKWVVPEKRGWFEPIISSIETPDAGTVIIKTKAPSHALVSYLSLLGMVPAKAGQAAGENYGAAPSGTGPYKLVKYTPGDRVELQARPDYWGGKPKNDKVTIRFIKEDATRLAALEAGEVQVAEGVSPDSLDRIKGSGNLDVLSVPSARTVFIAFMPDRPPFNNKDLRQAVMYAIDRQALVDTVLGGYGQVAHSMFAPSVSFFKPQKEYPYDLNKAKELIAKSGFDTSKTIKYAHPSGRTINDKAVGEAIAGMLEKAGLKVEIDAPEWGTYLENYQRRRIYDTVMASMAPDNLDPDYALFPWFRSDTSFIKYSDPKVDEMLKQGAEAVDPKAEEQIYGDLQTYLWDELPYAPLYVVPQLWAKSKNVDGFQLRQDSLWVLNDAVVN